MELHCNGDNKKKWEYSKAMKSKWQKRQKKVKLYIYNNLLAWDRSLNALAGGDSRETISGRLGKDPDSSFLARWLYKFLNWLESKHCENSIRIKEEDIGSYNVF